MTLRSNVVLIGMPGSGKSTLGVLVAKALGLDFVDTDLLLQKQEGLRLADILAREGSSGFLDLENRLLAGLEVEKTVVATGGSAIYHEPGMVHMKSLGPVVWIDVPFKELRRRLGDLVARGVVLAPGQSLKGLFEERRPLYERWADIRLDSGKEAHEATVARVVGLLAGPAR